MTDPKILGVCIAKNRHLCVGGVGGGVGVCALVFTDDRGSKILDPSKRGHVSNVNVYGRNYTVRKKL